MHILELLAIYKYPLLFIAAIPAGEAILFPAVYLIFVGVFEWNLVFLLTLLGTLVADVVWYSLGRFVSHERLMRLPFLSRLHPMIDRFGLLFRHSGGTILFASKFAFGTRTVAQILCGIYHMPFWKYITINVSGAFAWFVLLFSATKILRLGAETLLASKQSLEIGFAAVICIAITLQYILTRIIKDRIARARPEPVIDITPTE